MQNNKKSNLVSTVFITTLMSASSLLLAEDAPSEMTLKYGIGTDANLGLAFGAGINMDMKFGNSEVQAGPVVYLNRWTWSGLDGVNTYNEKATTMVFGGLINATIPSADPTLSILYGYGAAFVLYNYQQTSPDDTSIGPYNAASGLYEQDDTYTGVGVVTNIGVNKRFSDTLELQFEMPLIITPVSFAPAFTVSLLRQL